MTFSQTRKSNTDLISALQASFEEVERLKAARTIQFSVTNNLHDVIKERNATIAAQAAQIEIAREALDTVARISIDFAIATCARHALAALSNPSTALAKVKNPGLEEF